MLDAYEGRHGTEQPGDLSPRGEQVGPAVAPGQAHLQRLDARGEGRALALTLLLLQPERGHLAVGRDEPGGGRLVLLVQADLSLVEPGDLGLEGVEL